VHKQSINVRDVCFLRWIIYLHIVSTQVCIIGGGPVGLRTAVELSFLGASAVVVEKRTDFNRHNILHLWDWVCSDLLLLGASGAEILGKSFFHIATDSLQVRGLIAHEPFVI